MNAFTVNVASLTLAEHKLLNLAKLAARDTYVNATDDEAKRILTTFLAVESDPRLLLGWLLQRLGAAWAVTVTLTAQASNDQWQLRIASPAHWDEHFSYTYRGSLASVIARAYAGEPDDSDEVS